MTERVSPTGRAALRESLLQFSAFADALESRAMREAIEACITVLDAPGPLDKRVLAPWLKVVHERAADVFRRGIRETTGTLRAQMMHGLKQAEEDAHWMQQTIDALSRDHVN
ncbi:hypothetical protein SOCEGT47_052660 [Sorangium cellulosum]|jgi:hypothetical protein|uniref:Uncharacterized protein n=1 Tax=Sorangium cellulosum TaxID=56 RepID=A0A4P2Q5M0_SORCE|nr:hypothetical protein [Sorangium cellulosum]AUX24727.1 hypothetical protein SOCEGT47_052660 [Sorangium cellulosum]